MSFEGKTEEDVAFAVAFGEAADEEFGSNNANVEVPKVELEVAPEAPLEAPEAPLEAPATPTEPVAEPVAAPSAPSASEQAILAELTRLQQENAELKKPAAAVQPAQPVAPEEPAYVLSDEAKLALDTVAAEFPEVAAAMKFREEQFKATVMAEAKKMIAEAISPFQQQLNPLLAKTQQSEVDTFKETVIGAHPDATMLLPEVDKWILTLPRHKQVGANFVLDSGTAQEVVDLLTEFKKETGRVPAPIVTPPVTPTKDSSRLHSMEVVSTRRSASTTGAIDETDFSGAFAAAI